MHRSLWPLTVLLAACAGAPVAKAPPEAPARAAPDPGTRGPGEPLSAQGRRLFDEAVAVHGEMERSRAVDWAVLERRWRAVTAVADLPEAHFNLGVALERQGRDQEARTEYQRALAGRPLRQAAVNLGVLLERAGDSRGAQAAYDQVTRDHPEDAVSRERLAELYRQSGQLDEAWRQAREALLRDPTSVGAGKTMIRVALARGDVDLAKLVALRLQKRAPDDAEVAYLSGLLLSKQGDDGGAALQWKKALERQPGLAAARVGLLEVAVKEERWSEVESLATRALSDDPASAPIQLLVGIAWRHLGKADEALAAYASAGRLAAGKLPEVHLARGVLLMRDRGDCDGALRAFEQYERAAGPLLPQGSPAPRLMRECQEQLEQARGAAEAARQLRSESARTGRQEATSSPAGKATNQAPATSADREQKGDIAPSPTPGTAPRTRP
jgi:tetratricopeptide (TPR) repeat protein